MPAPLEVRAAEQVHHRWSATDENARHWHVELGGGYARRGARLHSLIVGVYERNKIVSAALILSVLYFDFARLYKCSLS